MKIAITGHRPNKLDDDYDLKSDLILEIKSELNKIVEKYRSKNLTLISGMALGIDTLWAKIAIENELPLIAAIPCLYQDQTWPFSSKERYRHILANPLVTSHYVTNDPYNNYCMQLRNKWMVDNCDLLIAVWDETSGGTANCVKYAKSVKKQIIYINPNQISIKLCQTKLQ